MEDIDSFIERLGVRSVVVDRRGNTFVRGVCRAKDFKKVRK